MSVFKKLVFFISVFLLYFVIKEMLIFFDSAFSLSSVLGYIALTTVAVIVFWFLILPLFKILRMPKHPGPIMESSKEKELISKRLNKFRNNIFLIEKGFQFDDSKDIYEQYSDAVNLLKKECDQIRKQHVRRLFYGSTISQNGFLDALLILSVSVNLIRDIFILYAGRVSNRDLLTIGRMVYYSAVVGGSESVEYLTEELFSKLASDGLKGIPFLGRITGSIADGFVNAALLTRVSFIAENYCSMTYISDISDMYPKFKTVYSTSKHIVSGLMSDASNLSKGNAGSSILKKISGIFGRKSGEDMEDQPKMV